MLWLYDSSIHKNVSKEAVSYNLMCLDQSSNDI